MTLEDRDNQTDKDKPTDLSQAPIPSSGKMNQGTRLKESRPMAVNMRPTSNKIAILKNDVLKRISVREMQRQSK